MATGLTKFLERLAELSNAVGEEEALSTVNNAINTKLKSVDTPEQNRVHEIRIMVELGYGLQDGELNGSFSKQNKNPKVVWINACLKVFDNNRPKVKKLIGNGLSRQYMHQAVKIFEALDEKFPHEKEMLKIYNQIIESYE